VLFSRGTMEAAKRTMNDMCSTVETSEQETQQEQEIKTITSPKTLGVKGCFHSLSGAYACRSGWGHESKAIYEPKENQDRALIAYDVGGQERLDSGCDVSVFGVLDGHGGRGGQLAEYVKDKLPEFLAAEGDLYQPDRTGQAIKTAVEKLCQHLQEVQADPKTNTTRIETKDSGTTVCLAVCVQKSDLRKLVIANIGDCRCIIIRKADNGSGKLEAVQLSHDHTTGNAAEMERVKKGGGVVQYANGYYRIAGGPNSEGRGSLPMSRIIGDDCTRTWGIITEPEITEYTLTDRDLYVVLVSDGVTKFIANSQVADAFKARGSSQVNIETVAQDLVSKAWQSCMNQDKSIDDCTCAVVDVNYLPSN